MSFNHIYCIPVTVQAAHRPNGHRVQEGEQKPVNRTQPRGEFFVLVEKRLCQDGHQHGDAHDQVHGTQVREQHVDRRARL